MNNKSCELSVIIPAYNEENRIIPTLETIYNYFKTGGASFEIIVVNDGSTDLTEQIVNEQSKNFSELKLISLPRNKGKGAAVKCGMLSALGTYRLFCDADGSTEIGEIEKLQDALRLGYDVAIGSRAIKDPNSKIETKLHRKILGRIFNNVINLLVVPGVLDTQCGFKLFKASVAEYLFSKQTRDGFSFDVELLYLMQKSGISLIEVPINWTNKEGSKVNLIKDSIKMFFDSVSLHFIHKNLKKADLGKDSAKKDFSSTKIKKLV
jgi:dolichyl-phosphate beta-glucosyltransferase